MYECVCVCVYVCVCECVSVYVHCCKCVERECECLVYYTDYVIITSSKLQFHDWMLITAVLCLYYMMM